VKFAWVDAEKANFPITKLCQCLGVSTSGFHAWRQRPESKRRAEDRKLTALVHAAYKIGRTYYGSPRVHRELAAQNVAVSRKRVIRLMQQEGLAGRVRRRYRITTMSNHDQAIAPNLLGRQFTPAAPNESWAGDVTEITTGSGKLYLAVILDLCSRFVVGWALSACNDRYLALRALDVALRRRRPGAGLLHHTDQGSPYASEDYQRVLSAHGITCSMSRRGNCYDNAVVESFFSTLKAEIGERFLNHGAAKHLLFDYIEVFYNRQRRHSSLGYMSPAEYESLKSAA
jgi:transposase InsO family protein